MKICHLYDGHEMVAPGQGSVPTVVYYLASSLAKAGHEVMVVERKWKGLAKLELREGINFVRVELKMGSNIPWTEVPYEQVKTPYGLVKFFASRTEFGLRILKLLKQTECDIIHVHLPFASTILVNLNKKLRDKMIYTAHIGEERKRFALDSSAPLTFKLFSPDLYLMKRVKKSIVLNESLKKKLIERGISEERLDVIPNGINVEDFNVSERAIEKIKAKYGLTGIVIMFAGTITPRKGVLQLIRAGEILKQKDILFLIVGNLSLDKEYAQKVIKYSKDSGVNVRFTGFVPYNDLKALYSACDIFVLPSFEEGQPIVLLEAMASGKPLIGSNVGGISMMIRDGWNGFLIEPGNEKKLADKIRYLVENEDERKRMGKNSRKLAKEEFDWSKIAERYLRIYEKVAR